MVNILFPRDSIFVYYYELRKHKFGIIIFGGKCLINSGITCCIFSIRLYLATGIFNFISNL